MTDTLTTETPDTTYAALPTVNARISPRGGLDILSRAEIARLRDASSGGLHELLRRCALAVLTTGADSDDPRAAQLKYPDFDLHVQQQDRGIKIELRNAPAVAFVEGEIIRGVAELLYAVVRDIAYVAIEINGSDKFDLDTSDGITGAVFEILRNARVLRPHVDPNLVVCWGGHSIGRDEYNYTKRVGYEVGLRRLDICTGCGPGAMKDQPRPVKRAPGDEGPRGAVPETTYEHREEEVAIGAEARAVVSAEGDVEVVAQPAREREVPAPPEVGDGDGGVGAVEVLRELVAEEARAAVGDVGVGGEVEIDLHGVRVRSDDVHPAERQALQRL